MHPAFSLPDWFALRDRPSWASQRAWLSPWSAGRSGPRRVPDRPARTPLCEPRVVGRWMPRQDGSRANGTSAVTPARHTLLSAATHRQTRAPSTGHQALGEAVLHDGRRPPSDTKPERTPGATPAPRRDAAGRGRQAHCRVTRVALREPPWGARWRAGAPTHSRATASPSRCPPPPSGVGEARASPTPFLPTE